MERDDEMFWSECDDCRAPIFVQRAEGPLRYRLTCDCRALLLHGVRRLTVLTFECYDRKEG